MPRLTRNSRESGPVVSGVVNVSSEQASSESRTSIGATSGASTTTNTVVQSGTSNNNNNNKTLFNEGLH